LRDNADALLWDVVKPEIESEVIPAFTSSSLHIHDYLSLLDTDSSEVVYTDSVVMDSTEWRVKVVNLNVVSLMTAFLSINCFIFVVSL